MWRTGLDVIRADRQNKSQSVHVGAPALAGHVDEHVEHGQQQVVVRGHAVVRVGA
jgi:hypothetical protein